MNGRFTAMCQYVAQYNKKIIDSCNINFLKHLSLGYGLKLEAITKIIF